MKGNVGEGKKIESKIFFLFHISFGLKHIKKKCNGGANSKDENTNIQM